MKSKQYHSAAVTEMIALLKKNSKDILRNPFDTDTFLSEAEARAGARFVSPDIPVQLEHVLRGYRASTFNALGKIATRERLLHALTERLRAEKAYEFTPNLKAAPVHAPIIILGLPRSGTTRLHRMLTLDPRIHGLKTWEAYVPAPRFECADFGLKERISVTENIVQTFQNISAHAARYVHPIDTHYVEEEIAWLAQGFFEPFGGIRNKEVLRAMLEEDHTDAYIHLRSLLQLVRFQHGNLDEEFVLKTPLSMCGVGALYSTFPDAKFIFVHRDPAQCALSYASLLWHFIFAFYNTLTKKECWERSLDSVEIMTRRSMVERARIPSAQTLDITFTAMNHDWKKELLRIYAFLGISYNSDMDAIIKTSQHTGVLSLEGGGMHTYTREEYSACDISAYSDLREYAERYCW